MFSVDGLTPGVNHSNEADLEDVAKRLTTVLDQIDELTEALLVMDLMPK
eukprot:gene27981-34591_t